MIKELEKLYPEGSDITIMNTFYQYAIRDKETKQKICDDFIYITYKDNLTGKKNLIRIDKPTYIYYMSKPNETLDYSRLFIERDKVDPIEVPFSKLYADIAKRIGQEDFYNIQKFNRSELEKLHLDPRLFNSDTDIESHYRFRFAQTYKNSITKLNKAFFDIEVDSKWAAGDFVEMGECAINCVSFMDEKSDISYTFILRDNRNPLIEIFENKIRTGQFGYKEIHDFVVKSVGGPNKAKKFKLMDTKFKLKFYDHEIDLIRDLFFTIHSCSPDFVEGWNSSAFDLEYIIERVKVLGFDPADILCDQRYFPRVVKNFVDSFHANELAERGDYTFISGLPVFIDQMIQYASRRKSKIGSIKGTKLDDIGELEAGVKKLDYSHITQFIEELPWLDFETFVLYNIMDVVVQKCIETKTNDLEYIFAKCVVNNTPYKKGHRQTVYLINRMANDFYKMGYIIGNNQNKKNPMPPKFLGALVHNPENTGEYCKMMLDGRELWICDNLQDYD